MKTKTFAEDEVVDFGIQMSEMLETLEAKNIFHGNISPKNIFVTADGRYKIGGFTDFFRNFMKKLSIFDFFRILVYYLIIEFPKEV